MDVLMIGTGEYTTGFVHTQASVSDKTKGVIALVLFDLRRRYRLLGTDSALGTFYLVGTNGTKFPAIRKHLQEVISDEYNGLDVTVETYPADDVEKDAEAYKKAIDKVQKKGACVTVFTPDDTHYDIAKYAIERQCHVLLTKPPVKTLKEHLELAELAEKHNVVLMCEYHKVFDPVYIDARYKIQNGGHFNYFNSFMSQPKFQLHTFKAWAGKSSDISYYLNSHHIQFHAWCMEGKARPLGVKASCATGVAESSTYGCPAGTEDTITLLVDWETPGTETTNPCRSFRGTAVYTASWSVPVVDCHSQQFWHYLGSREQLLVDQAHRGYQYAVDGHGNRHINPHYMAYHKTADGHFGGTMGYGYRSLEAFVECCVAVREGIVNTVSDLYERYPMVKSWNVVVTTAILEAGRRSLDAQGKSMKLIYKGDMIVDIKEE